jgi:hypothetical protein
MLRSKLKHHFINKKIDKLSKTLSSSSNRPSQKINSIGIITSDCFSKQHDFSQILNQKFQFRNPKIYSFRKFSKGNQKTYKLFYEKYFHWRGDIHADSIVTSPAREWAVLNIIATSVQL